MFAAVTHFHLSLIFAGKAGAYPSGAQLKKKSFNEQGPYSQQFIFFVTYE